MARKKVMRLPNGLGSIAKLSGKRRKPFVAKVNPHPIVNEEKKRVQYQYDILGYYATREEAMNALFAYNQNPYDLCTASITFAELYEKFKIEKTKDISAKSFTAYTSAYGKCESLYNMIFSDIRKSHMQAIIDQHMDKSLSTRKNLKALFSQMYIYASQNDINYVKDYSEFLDCGDAGETVIKRVPFSNKEIDTLWANIGRMEYIDTILILIYTGMRVMELMNMERKNVHLEERYMIGGSKTASGKNRYIPIHDRILPLVEQYYNMGNKYLITNTEGRPFCYSNYAQKKWAHIMEQLSMTHLPHDTRHTFASLMDTAGAKKLVIKRIMGHQDKDITDRVYTHKDISELLEEVNKLS